jgi:tetratricopeptide (TPR) repeat protein
MQVVSRKEISPEAAPQVTGASGRVATSGQVHGDNVAGDVITNSPSIYIRESAVTIGDKVARQPVDDHSAAARLAPSMLPPDIADFVGRDTELDILKAALATPPFSVNTTVTVVQVTGQPGSGKSALAIHLAHALYDRFPDGLFYVDLRGADREPLAPAAVLDVFLYAAGVPTERVPGDLTGRQALYRTWLSGKRVFIVLDNAVDAAQVEALLPNRPPAAVVVTSREPMPTLPGGKPLILQTLNPSSAVDLLWAVARRERTAADDRWAELVAERCGFLPLALRIASATLLARPHWSMRKLADSLADEHTRLRQLSRQGLGMGTLDVRASVDLSYAALDADLARSFRLLGATNVIHFCTDLAAATIGLPAALTSNHLDRLTDAQILEPYQGDGSFRFHDLIRLYARERLEDASPPEERAEAQDRALSWYVELAESTYQILHPSQPLSQAATSQQNAQADALAQLDAERLNLLPVMTAAVSSDRWWPSASRLSFALGGYFRMRSAWDDWARIGQLGLEASRQFGDEHARAKALLSLGSLRELTDELDLAIGYCQESLSLSRRLGDRLAQFENLRVLGIVALKQDHLDDAIRDFQECLLIANELDYGWGIGASLHHLGRIYRKQGRLDEAITSSRQSLAVSRRLGNRWGEATNLNTLGHELYDKGELKEAIESFGLARGIYLELGDRWGVASSSHSLGLALRDHGEQALGATYLLESKNIYQELGAGAQLDQVRQSLGEAT